jgi:hypothetical protein
MLEVNSYEHPIPPITIPIEGIKKVYLELNSALKELKQQHKQDVQNRGISIEDELDAHINNSYQLNVSIIWEGGAKLNRLGDQNIFESLNASHKIQSINFDSKISYRMLNPGNEPPNSIVLHLDFSQPLILEWRTSISGPTLNNSILTTQGNDYSWQAGVEKRVFEVINNYKNRRTFLHKPFSYDIILYFLVLPLAFYEAAKFSPFIENNMSIHSSFFGNLGYAYFFLSFLILYRLLYGFGKYAFPPFELDNQKSKSLKWRKWLFSTIILFIIPIIVSTLYDVLKYFLQFN